MPTVVMLRLRIGLTDDDASRGEVALEPVTNQVTTGSGSGRPSATQSDTGIVRAANLVHVMRPGGIR
jgi:hypothetical protein